MRYGAEFGISQSLDAERNYFVGSGGVTARSEIESGDRFAFGENWQRFLDLVDEDRIRAAEGSLRDFLGVQDLAGQSFVDVGSGSGLFSLAARRLGARVVSFDFDPASVACTTELRHRYFPDDEDWRVEQGSALDRRYLASLGTFDVVYSWGVLHHTGDLWGALEAVTTLVAPDGLLYIALYNDQGPISTMWTAVKRRYNHSGPAGRRVILATVGGGLAARAQLVDIVKRRPLRRGMDRWRDIEDWIGGWPFEVSSPESVVAFFERHGFRSQSVRDVGRRMGNNEFLFRANGGR